MAEVKFTDNSGEVLDAMSEAVRAALEAIGQQAVSHAKQTIAEAGRVDTGALQNSISHMVDGNDVYVGTNQEYAIFHEMGTGIYLDGGGGRQTPWSYQDAKGVWHRTRGIRPIHMIKNAAANHTEEYESIIEKTLKGG